MTNIHRSGFHGFGDSEQNVQAMAEQVLVQLTTLHHNYRNDQYIPFSEKVRASKVIRSLADVFNDYAYSGLKPSRELLGIYDAIQVERDYTKMTRLAHGLLRELSEHLYRERAIQSRLYRFRHKGELQ